MKHIMKVSTNSKQHKIILTPHSTVNPANTINIFRMEWDLLNETPDRFADFIAANIWKYAARYGINLFSNGHEPLDYVNSVWLDMYDRLFSISGVAQLEDSIRRKYAKGKTEVKLLHPMWQSIDAVFKREKRQWECLNGKKKSKDDPKATHDEATTWQEDADKFVPIEAMANGVDFEDQVITSVAVRQVMATFNERWVEIAHFKAEGMTDQKIGDRVGLKRGMVNVHIQQMRAAFRAADLR